MSNSPVKTKPIGGLSKSPSEDFVPCDKASYPKDTEVVFSAAILPPLYITAAYLVLLRAMSNSLDNEQNENPESDPFKNGKDLSLHQFCILFSYLLERNSWKIENL